MDELQNRLASFIRVEEGRAYQRGREEVEPMNKIGRDRRGDRWMFGRGDGGNGQRGEGQFRVPQYVHHTPLNVPRTRVMEEALRADLLTVVKTPTPLGANESKYCRYHQNREHTTKDCTTLKDKLESLVQEGHLREFVQRGGPSSGGGSVANEPTHPRRQNHKREGRRSRSRSRDRTVRG